MNIGGVDFKVSHLLSHTSDNVHTPIDITDLDRPLRLPVLLDNLHTKVAKLPYAPAVFTPTGNISDTHFR